MYVYLYELSIDYFEV